jgi:hypothetical protein
MLPSSISSSVSPTIRHLLLLRMCNTLVSGMSWVVTVAGTISTPAPTIVQIGPSRMSMSCGRWSASVMTPVMPLAASGCSRVRAPAAPIWKSATYEWRARPICCLTSPYAILSSALAAQGTLRVSSATLTTQIKSSRAPLLTRFATIVTHINAIGRWLSCRHACLPRDASIAISCICFSSSPTNRQTTTLMSLDIRRTKRSFATAAVSSFTATGAPLGWHVLKLWRCVAPPPPRDAILLSLAGERGAGEARGGGSPTCRPATGSLTAFVGLIVTHPPR